MLVKIVSERWSTVEIILTVERCKKYGNLIDPEKWCKWVTCKERNRQLRYSRVRALHSLLHGSYNLQLRYLESSGYRKTSVKKIRAFVWLLHLLSCFDRLSESAFWSIAIDLPFRHLIFNRPFQQARLRARFLNKKRKTYLCVRFSRDFSYKKGEKFLGKNSNFWRDRNKTKITNLTNLT